MLLLHTRRRLLYATSKISLRSSWSGTTWSVVPSCNHHCVVCGHENTYVARRTACRRHIAYQPSLPQVPLSKIFSATRNGRPAFLQFLQPMLLLLYTNRLLPSRTIYSLTFLHSYYCYTKHNARPTVCETLTIRTANRLAYC